MAYVTKKKPKQYLEIFNRQSLFEMTVAQNKNCADAIMVLGNIDNNHLSKRVLDKINTSYFNIIESTPRNTAAAIAFDSDPDAILLVTSSDPIIEDLLKHEIALFKAFVIAK